MSASVQGINPNLKEAILFLLSPHHGQWRAISREDLLFRLAGSGFHDDERIVRAAIAELQDEGHLIGSSGGRGGGYWLMDSWPEVDEFCEHQVRSRALSLLHKERQIRHAALQQLGPRSTEQMALPVGE